jgi:hypothetical protein
MPDGLVATLSRTLSILRPHMTVPTCARMALILYGWVLAAPRAGRITDALLCADLSATFHWAAFHRVFSRAAWNLDALGASLFHLVVRTFKPTRVQFALDDTLAHHKGAHVFGTSMHVDPVSSSRKHKNFVRAHCWVVLSVVIDVPWSARPWAIPLLFRLYQGKQGGLTKNQLGRAMLDVALRWLRTDQTADLLIDAGFMSREILRDLPASVTVYGAMRTNVALYDAPVRNLRGRPRLRGVRQPTPAQRAHDPLTSFRRVAVYVYQACRHPEVFSVTAQWYHVCGPAMLHVVLTRATDGMLRVFACTDPTVPAAKILEAYARRWSLERWFFDSKQFWCMADSPAWTERAVLRIAPWVGLMSGILVVWFHAARQEGWTARLPVRPWYTTKTNVSMADVLRAAQDTLRTTSAVSFARQVAGHDLALFRKEQAARKATENPARPGADTSLAA